MTDLRVPIRQQGSGLPTLGFIAVPVEGNPKDPANAGDLSRLRIGKQIWDVGAGGDDAYDWATVGHDDERVPPAKLGTGTPGATVFLRGDGVWAAPPTGGMGSATWLGLSDTPASWGTEGQHPAINAAGDALEWATPLATYYDGNGHPPGDPPVSGALSTDNAGKVYPTITDHVIHTVASSWTTVDLTFGQPERFWRGVDPDSATLGTTDGRFYWDPAHDTFVQRRGTSLLPASWLTAWAYIAGVDVSVDYRLSIYLGQFRSAALARAAMDANATAVARYAGGTEPADNMKAYWIDTRRDTLVEVTTYTASSTTHSDHLVWGDALPTRAEVEALIATTGTFLGLTDTPAAFGTEGQHPVINAAEDALEWVDQVREHWRGEWEANVSTAKAGDLWYTVRTDFSLNSENVVWLALEDTSLLPEITQGRQWLNLTDTDHYRGEIFEHVIRNDVEMFLEHGDTFLYDDSLYFALHEVALSINDILNGTTDYTENVKQLTQTVPTIAEPVDGSINVDFTNNVYTLDVNENYLAAHITARVADWAEHGNTSVIPGSKLSVFDWAKTPNTDLIPTNKLGAGTANATTFLRGDRSWAAAPSPITRPEPGTAAAASFDAIYGGGAGASGQDYLSYKRIVANHTVRVSVHNLNEIGFTTSKRGWASEAGLIQGNIVGGSARPAPDGFRGIMEYRGAGGDWRLWIFTDNTGEWTDDTRDYDIKYVEVGSGNAATTVRLEHDLVTDLGEWREQDATRTTPRWEIGKQYDIQIRRVGTSADVVLHAGNEIARLADATELDSVHGELLALIDDIRHQAGPFDWATEGNTSLIPEAKLPPISADNIVFPDAATGMLRAGMASDWNATHGYSEVFGWTGSVFQRISRTPVAAVGSFAAVPDGNTLAPGYRWRGVFASSVDAASPQNGDVLFSTATGKFAYRTGGNWVERTPPSDDLPGIVSETVFADEATALATPALTASGQRVLITVGGTTALYQATGFTAAHNTYPWVDVATGGGTDDRIVFPDDMGMLRAGTADDWDATNNFSKVFGWTGSTFQRLSTMAVPKSATFTPFLSGDNLLDPGLLIWRGVVNFVASVSNPVLADIVFETGNTRYARYNGTQWLTVNIGDAALAGSGLFSETIFADEAAALAAVTQQGQRAMIASGGSTGLFTATNFVAAHTAYPWVDVFTQADAFDPDNIQVVSGELTRSVSGDVVTLGFPGITDEVFQDGLFRNLTPGAGLQISYDDVGNEFELLSRTSSWALQGNTSRIPLSKMSNTMLSALDKFEREFRYFNLGSLAQDLPATPLSQLVLNGDPFFTLQSGNLIRIDDELMEFNDFIGAGMRTLGVARSVQGTMIAAHTAGTAVFAQDHSREFITLDFARPDGTKTGETAVELPFATLDTIRNSLVSPWALVGNTNVIPNTKVGAGTPDGTKYLLDTGAWSALPPAGTHTEPWALLANPTVRVPTGKLGSGTVSTAVFLRGDGTWADPDAASAIHKLTDNSDVTFTTSGGRRRVNLAISGASNAVGTIVLFQYHQDPSTTADMEIEVGINNSGYVRVKWDNPLGGGLDNLRLEDITRYNLYLLYRAGSFWHKIGGTDEVRAASWAQAGNTDDIPADKLPYQTADWAREGNTDRIPSAKMAYDVEAWARQGNTTRVPVGKLGSGTANASNFLRGDGAWTRPTLLNLSDAPDVYGTASQILAMNAGVNGVEWIAGPEAWARLGDTSLIPTSKILPDIWKITAAATYSTTSPSPPAEPRRRIAIAQNNANNNVGTMLLFQYTDGTLTPTDRGIELGLNGSNYAPIRRRAATGVDDPLELGDVVQNQFFLLYRDTFSWRVLAEDKPGGGGAGVTAFLALIDTPTVYGTAGQVPAMNSNANALEWKDPTALGFSLIQQATGDVVVTTGSTWPTSANMGLDYTLPPDSENALLAIDAGRVTSSTGEFTNGLIWIRANDIEKLAGDAYGGAVGSSRNRVEDHLPGNVDLFIGYVEVSGQKKLLLTSSSAGASLYNAKVFKVVASGTRSFNFLSLEDTPSGFGTAGQGVVVNAAADGLEFGDLSTTFQALSDTPDDLGTHGQYPAVNAAGDALEWVGPAFEFVTSFNITHTSTAYTIALDGLSNTAAPTGRILAINFVGPINFTPQRPDSLPVRMTYNGLNAGNVQLFGADNNRRNFTLGDLRTYGTTNVLHMFKRRSGGWDWVGTSGAASTAQDIAALVYDWAQVGDTSRIPVAKLGGGTADSTTYLRGDGTWAAPSGLTDNYVDDVTLSLSGQDLTLTLGRTSPLANLSDTITLPSGGGGSSTFVGLTDTPASLGSAGQFVRVNTAGTALEFVAAPSGGGDDAFDWATVGDTSLIPTGKLGTGTADATTVLYGDGTWKLAPAGSGGGLNKTTAMAARVQQSTVIQTSSDTQSSTNTSTWRVLRQTGNTVLETAPIEIKDLNDVVYLSANGVAYFGQGTVDSVQLEQQWRVSESDTEGGTYTTPAAITGSSWTTVNASQGITFRSKLASGDPDTDHRDYQPATFVSGTWADMGYVAADVGKFIKFSVAHRKAGSDSANLSQRYGWKLAAMVLGQEEVLSDVTGGGTSTFLGLSDTPSAFGTAGQIVAVNAAGDALEFIAAPSGGSGISASDLETWWGDFDVAFTHGSSGLTLNLESDDGTNQSASISAQNFANIIARIGGSNGQYLKRVSGSSVEWDTPAGGGGSGDDAYDWATEGNTSTIPNAKIGPLALDKSASGLNVRLTLQYDGNSRDTLDIVPADVSQLLRGLSGYGDGKILYGQPTGQAVAWADPQTATGLNAEEVMDLVGGTSTQDPFVVAGEGIETEYIDANNTFIIRTKEAISRLTVMIGVEEETSQLYYFNPDDPSVVLSAKGRINVSGRTTSWRFNAGAWHNGSFYVVDSNTDELIRVNLEDPGNSTLVGVVSFTGSHLLDMTSYDGELLATAGEQRIISVHTTNPGNSTEYTGLAVDANYIVNHEGTLYFLTESNLYRVDDLSDLANDVADLGSIGLGGTEGLSYALSYRGSIYSSWHDTTDFDNQELWRIDHETPGNSGSVGAFPTAFDVNAADTVELAIDSSFIREGDNLYWTQARFDSAYGIASPFINVDPGDNLPAATADNEDKMPVQGTAQSRQIFKQQVVTVGTTTVTTRLFNNTDLPSAYGYQGTIQEDDSAPTSGNNGNDVYYVRNSHQLIRWDAGNNRWLRLSWAAIGNNFVGHFFNKADADSAVEAHYNSSPADALGEHVAYGNGSPGSERLYTITAFTQGTIVRNWVPIDFDVRNALENLQNQISGGMGDDAYDWATEGDTSLVPTDKLGTGTADNSVFLRGDGTWNAPPASRFIGADDDGDLRDPTADDWNDSHSFSKVLGFDGFQFYRVKRELTGGHGASASYSTVATNTTFTQGGVTYTYKGSHQHDYNVSASINDFYFHWSSGYWRVFRARGTRTHDYWENVDVRDIIPTYIGDWDTQAEALSHISATGQYVVYILNNAYTLRRVTAYTAPSAGNVTYDWEQYLPFTINDFTNDIRTIIERNAHTYYEKQTFHVGDTSGERVAMEFTREDHGEPWGAIDFDVGGSIKPGISFGFGSDAPDVTLYRDAANTWRTPDTFHAGVFDVDDDGQETTLDNLGAMGRHTESTIEGDGTADNPLKVSVNDVTETISERIKHFTNDSLDFSGKGASVGHVYTTGPYRTSVTRVIAHVDAPNSGGTYVCRIYTLHSDNRIDTHIANSNTRNLSSRGNHYFDFASGSNTIPTNSRIAVLISRTDDGNDGNATMRVGENANNSPETSYDDATVDFNWRGWVEYERITPDSGRSTHTHDTDGEADNDAYGDLSIQYRRIFDHGNFVGDGNVDASHIDSGSEQGDRALFADAAGGAHWVQAARLENANTFEAAQTIDFDGLGLIVDGRGYTGSAPVFEVRVGGSGGQKAFQLKKESDNTAWASFEYVVGGSGKPGFALGPGGSSGRDTALYRDGSNLWRTPDAFHVGELRVDSGGRLNSRQQLGLGSAATANTGTNAGNVPVLDSSGKIDADRIIRPFRDVAYGSTITWNVESSPRAEVTLTGDATLAIQDDTDGGIYVLSITQNSTGGHDVTFPSGWEWAGGTADEVATGANDNSILTIMRVGSRVVAAPLLKEVA